MHTSLSSANFKGTSRLRIAFGHDRVYKAYKLYRSLWWQRFSEVT
jgi:hypothetical protein